MATWAEELMAARPRVQVATGFVLGGSLASGIGLLSRCYWLHWTAPTSIPFYADVAEFGMPLLPSASAFATVLALLLSAWPWARRRGSLVMLGVLAGSLVVGCAWSLVDTNRYSTDRYSYDSRVRAFEHVPERGAPLVEAILRFEEQHGEPPADLEQLVPDYLPSIPRPSRRGRFEYDVWPARAPRRTWQLYVDASIFFVNMDMFVYDPERQYGGNRYRFGDWVYFVE